MDRLFNGLKLVMNSSFLKHVKLYFQKQPAIKIKKNKETKRNGTERNGTKRLQKMVLNVQNCFKYGKSVWK